MIDSIVPYFPHKKIKKIHYHILKILTNMREEQNITKNNKNNNKYKINNNNKFNNNLIKRMKLMV
jgi:hypothetical protein